MMRMKWKSLGVLSLFVLFFVILVPVSQAQTETDYSVQLQPSPLTDGSQRIGSTSDSLSTAQTQDFNYQDISEEGVVIFYETFPNSDTAWDGDGNGDTTQDETGWYVIQGKSDVNDVQVSSEAVSSGDIPPSGGSHLMFEDADDGFKSPEDHDLAYVTVDLSGYDGAILEYYWQTDDVDTGEGGRVAYSTDTTNGVDGTWTTINEFLNPTDDVWTKSTYVIPSSACVSNFTLRFSAKCNLTGEHIYFDDIKIVAYRLNWEHKVTGIGTHDNYYVRVYGYADSGDTFSISVWDGSSWVDNSYNLPSGSAVWVEYQIPSEWVIDNSVSIRYADDNDGNSSAASIHIDYAGVRGTTAPPTFDFSITAPSFIEILPGEENSVTLQFDLISGPSENVVLSGSWIGGTPAGISTTFSPFSGYPGYTSTLTFSASSGASSGNYTYRVTASGDTVEHTADITVVVGNPPFDFSLSASLSSISVSQGDTGTLAISVSLLSGSPKTVQLSGEWIGDAPSGVTPSLSHSSGDPPFQSTLSFTVASEASTGTFTYRVTGENDNLSKYVDVSVTITQATFNFSIEASLDNLQVKRGGDASTSLSVELLAGISKVVSLSGSWLSSTPTGLSLSLSNSVGTPPFTSSLSLQASSNATPGSFVYRITATGGGITKTEDITIVVNNQLSVSLSTDNDDYSKGAIIRLSGTVSDPLGLPVDNGSVNLRFTSGDWVVERTTSIVDGSFAENFQISYGYPEGQWTVEASAEDSSGNLGYASKTLSVSTPVGQSYYTVEVLSPVAGLSYSRGETIDISVRVTDGGTPVDNAEVYFSTPEGDSTQLQEFVPGTYTGQFTLGWDAPDGLWSISVECKKSTENVLKAGGVYVNVDVDPADLEITLLAPTDRSVEVGETLTIQAEVKYPDGTKVEDAIVSAVTVCENIFTLTYESPGIYTAQYTVKEEDVGNCFLEVAAEDLYGNDGSDTIILSVQPRSTLGVLSAYWWAVLSVVVAAGIATGVIVSRSRFSQRLSKISAEKREIKKLMKEAEIRYYKEGSITRATFDEIISGHEKRLADLEKEERILKRKVKERSKSKKAKKRKRKRKRK